MYFSQNNIPLAYNFGGVVEFDRIVRKNGGNSLTHNSNMLK